MLVSIIGPKGCGKSTVADHLVDHYGFRRVSVADSLKLMLSVIGLTPEQLYGSEKETPCDLLCGKTPRHAMQTLGTEWGREHIGEDIWIRITERRIRSLLDDGKNVVLDDVRFPDEAAMVHRLGGLTIRLRRPAAEKKADRHRSESYWREFPYALELDNTALRQNLLDRIDDALGLPRAFFSGDRDDDGRYRGYAGA